MTHHAARFIGPDGAPCFSQWTIAESADASRLKVVSLMQGERSLDFSSAERCVEQAMRDGSLSIERYHGEIPTLPLGVGI